MIRMQLWNWGRLKELAGEATEQYPGEAIAGVKLGVRFSSPKPIRCLKWIYVNLSTHSSASSPCKSKRFGEMYEVAWIEEVSRYRMRAPAADTGFRTGRQSLSRFGVDRENPPARVLANPNPRRTMQPQFVCDTRKSFR